MALARRQSAFLFLLLLEDGELCVLTDRETLSDSTGSLCEGAGEG